MFIEHEIRTHTIQDVKIMFPSVIQYKLISSQNMNVFLLEGQAVFFLFFFFGKSFFGTLFYLSITPVCLATSSSFYFLFFYYI